MSLREYRRKRDFRATPEPAGRAAPRGAGWSFVIQKHAATRLHYDFRLELDGVLKSWALPKGPSLDPADKRLAVETEDHPVEYGTFEGVIPPGQYGAGSVLLWDRGTWAPRDDPHRGLRAGKLVFTLDGRKLRGGWALVRLKGRSASGREWLLVKEKDAEAVAGARGDVTAREPRSVESGRDLEQVARDRDRTWTSNREEDPRGAAYRVAPAPRAAARAQGPRAAPFPRTLAPQLATPVEAPPQGDAWLHELKFDGERILARLDGGRVRLLSRTGRDCTDRYARVARLVAALPARRAWIDGVLTAVLADGTTSAPALRNGVAAAHGARLVYFAFDLLYLDDADLRRMPLEQRKGLLRDLLPPDQDAVRYSDHVVGDGPRFLDAACRMSLEGAVSKRRAGVHRPGHSSDWVKTRCVREREELSARAGGARGKAKRVRAPSRSRRAGAVEVAGVRLTHPERVVFAKAGVTKEELARAYERIGPSILPHLEDRPLTLVRCPEGAGAPCFFVKHAGPWTPRSVRRVRIQEKAKRAEYLVVDSLESLVALVQMNVLELHTWNARSRDLERPDRIVFDLDPGPGVAWGQVATAAAILRERLERLDLESFVKTTGGKGAHVVVPLAPRAGWDECVALSRAVSASLERDRPEAFLTDMSKAKRPGRILIDYARNHRGSTSVAAFSTRAKPDAPVSLPVAWDELADLRGGDAFTLADVERILGPRRADPWADYGARQRRQSVTSARLKKAHAL